MIDSFEKDVVHITIYGALAKITGDAPWLEVYEAASYAQEGAQFSKAYKRGLWNGRVYLINKKTQAFPMGLTSILKEVCEEAGKTVYVHDRRSDPGSLSVFHRGPKELKVYNMTGKYSHQMDTVNAVIAKGNGIVKVCTGGGKSACIASLVSYYQLPTLIVVPSVELLDQLRATLLTQVIGATEESIGRIGDGSWEIGTLATVATLDTLESRLNTEECQKLLASVDVLIADEVHYAGSDSWYDVLLSCNAYYRVAFSGTPLDRSDGANLKVIALFGDILIDIRTKELIAKGVLPDAKIIFDKITKPALNQGKISYATAYTMGVVENTYLNQRIVEWTKVCVNCGLSVLILIDQIKHGKLLDDMLWDVGDGQFIPHTFISGQASDKKNRKSGLQSFADREIPVLISSSILDTGVSLDTIDVLICAGSRKSKIKTIQRLGRALRGERAIVIEFANYTNKFLMDHSLVRLRDYKAEDCFEITTSGPDEELIKKLWNSKRKLTQ